MRFSVLVASVLACMTLSVSGSPVPDPYNLSVAGIVREAAPEPNPAKACWSGSCI
ncbi:hypothetical protein L208DRAFT_1416209 [Tricholoma matsutake]|nr:hypothetical protein L208DRAFT_1416209 [Tricholoma matsutake 945]